jgi:hypothetical protein
LRISVYATRLSLAKARVSVSSMTRGERTAETGVGARQHALMNISRNNYI